jgi:nucleoside-diphosphate-sugar epimerase
MNLAVSRVLITGATGGIGSALVDKLRVKGCELLLHENSKQGGWVKIFVRADLTTPEGLTGLSMRPQILILMFWSTMAA